MSLHNLEHKTNLFLDDQVSKTAMLYYDTLLNDVIPENIQKNVSEISQLRGFAARIQQSNGDNVQELYDEAKSYGIDVNYKVTTAKTIIGKKDEERIKQALTARGKAKVTAKGTAKVKAKAKGTAKAKAKGTGVNRARPIYRLYALRTGEYKGLNLPRLQLMSEPANVDDATIDKVMIAVFLQRKYYFTDIDIPLLTLLNTIGTRSIPTEYRNLLKQAQGLTEEIIEQVLKHVN
jgi:hypothetical protein